jgi:hypothetical protein
MNLNEIDTLIRSGQTSKAALQVTLLSQDPKLSRPNKLDLAKLARRSSIPKIGITLLRPYIRPSAKQNIQASDEEKIEYAANLSWIGALPECFSLLEEVDHKLHPDGDFIAALAHFAQWNYAEAIPLLLRYIAHPKVEAYWKRVGEVNLLSALVHEGLPCQELLEELEVGTKKDGQKLLLANILQFKAEMGVNRKDWQEAQAAIQEASFLMDSLFMQKWQAIILLYEDLDSGLKKLQEVREKAIEVKHWETVRDCDFHEVLVTHNKVKGLKIYFGTPYPAYRAHLLKKCPWLKEEIQETYDWKLGSAREHKKVIIPWEETREGLALQNLWETLASDFYSPLTLGHLHARIFPWKHFDPVRSANSIHQALKRLRELFIEEKIPLEIHEKNGEYYLHAIASVTLRIRVKPEDSVRRYPKQFEKVQTQFMKRKFTAKGVAECLGLSHNMALVYLRQWQKLGLIKKSSTGPRTHYSIGKSVQPHLTFKTFS